MNGTFDQKKVLLVSDRTIGRDGSELEIDHARLPATLFWCANARLRCVLESIGTVKEGRCRTEGIRLPLGLCSGCKD